MPRQYTYLGPDGIGAGTFTNPLLGEVVIGESYEVPEKHEHLFQGHAEWKRGRKSDGDNAGKE